MRLLFPVLVCLSFSLHAQVLPYYTSEGYYPADEKGNRTSSSSFDLAYPLQGNLFHVTRNNQEFMVDATGKDLIGNTIDSLQTDGDFVRFLTGSGWGVMDISGKVRIVAAYDSISVFRQGLAMMYKNGKCGLADTNGKIIAQPLYEAIAYEGECIKDERGYVAVKKENRWYMLELSSGERDLLYEAISLKPFILNNFLVFSVTTETGTGMYAYNTWLIEPLFEDAGTVKGAPYIYTKNEGVILYDHMANILYHEAIAEVPCFSGGVGFVGDKGKSGVINQRGRLIISPGFTAVEGPSEGVFSVNKDFEVGFMDTSGKWIQEPKYMSIHTENFHKGLAKVYDNTAFGYKVRYIKKDGSFVNQNYYGANSTGLENHLAFVEKDGFWGLMDSAGKEVLPCEYDNISSFIDGFAVIYKRGNAGVVDSSGKIWLPCEFDMLTILPRGFICARAEGKCGVVSTNGETVLPFIYDKIKPYNNDYIMVEKGDSLAFLKTGNFMSVFFHKSQVPSPVVNSELLTIRNEEGKLAIVHYTGAIKTGFIFSPDIAIIPGKNFGVADMSGKPVFFTPDGHVYIKPE